MTNSEKKHWYSYLDKEYQKQDTSKKDTSKKIKLYTDWSTEPVISFDTMGEIQNYLLKKAKKLWKKCKLEVRVLGHRAPCNADLTSFDKCLERIRHFYIFSPVKY